MSLIEEIIAYAQENVQHISEKRAQRVARLAPNMETEELESLYDGLKTLVEAKTKIADMDQAAEEKREKLAAHKDAREAQEQAEREDELEDAEALLDSLI